ncbi:MAG: DUF4340 domain-containing protein [Ruminococcus sp.]|nr:DUF4340 domain-containing protein [Ruminococcus sp.]
MSSRTKGIIAGLAVLLVLGIAAAIVLINKPPEDSAPAETTAAPAEVTSRLVYDIDPTKIMSILITNEKGFYEIARFDIEGQAVWSVEEYASLPLDNNFIISVMNSAAKFTAARIVTDTPSDLSTYGLESPRAEIVTLFEGGVIKDLLIGNPSPMAGESYAMLKGENTLYTVTDTAIANLLEGKNSVISKNVYTPVQNPNPDPDIPETRINKMTIDRTDLPYDIVIEYDKRKADPERIVSNQTDYIMTSPVRLDLDPARSKATTDTVYSLVAAGVTEVFPDEAKLAEYGFDNPLGSVSIDIVAGPFGMTFGDEYTDETGKVVGRYGMVEGRDVIYTFTSDVLPWTTIKPLDITSTIITANYIFDLSGVSITGSGFDEQFTLSGTSDDDFKVTHNGEAVTDTQAFKTFYQYLLRTPAEELYLEPTDAEPVLTVHIVGEDIDDKLEFITAEDRRTIIRFNDVVSFKCKTTFVDRLIDNIGLYNEGKPIITTW